MPRVNIITNHRNQTGLSQDADLIHGILAIVYGDELKVVRTPHQQPVGPECDMNIFLEVINPALFSFASKNIWIPNPEWTYTAWDPYLEMVDEIWVKTHEAEAIFSKLTTKPIVYIGWSSISKECSVTKDYSKAFVLVGKNIFRHPQLIVDAYAHSSDRTGFPELHIPYDSTRMNLTVPEDVASLIHTYPSTLKQVEYDSLLSDCGLAICLSGAEGFGHAVNEASSNGCNLLLGRIQPFEELTRTATWVESIKSTQHPECHIQVRAWSEETFLAGLSSYMSLPLEKKQADSEAVKNEYMARHTAWIEMMKYRLGQLVFPERVNTLPAEADLPCVSILTPTRDRIEFMRLARDCFLHLAYPDDKIEWVIVDDSEISCEFIFKGVKNVKYEWVDPGKTIAWKRNRAVELASHDVLVNMDDDDVYPNNSVIMRVASMLKTPAVQCVFCTTIPCYDIKKVISFINVPPLKLPMAARVSEATLAFTRSFWEAGKFDDTVKIAEGNAFIRGREHMCRELGPQDIIVSLVHPRTTSARKSPAGMESNGCHFGFSDDLFKAVSEIAATL